MSLPLQLIIESDGLVVVQQQAEQEVKLGLKEDLSLGEQLAEYSIANGAQGNNLLLFVSEDLLFYKSFVLPLSTQDLKEAISYQVGMLVPFEEDDLLYSFTSERRKDGYFITLVATSKKRIAPYLEELAAADFHIAGLYPAFQRFVIRNGPKERWALVTPGRSLRALLFNRQQVVERLILPDEGEFEELAEICETEEIYHLQPPSDSRFLDAGQLLTGHPLLKQFNLLPKAYRRPEYSKYLVILLVILNVVTLAAFVGGKEYRLRDYAARIDGEIAKVQPLAREARQLRSKEEKLNHYVDEFMAVGRNPDLITFLDTLTRALPDSAYLDQLRLDSKEKAVIVQGYTDDINALTAKLQDMGEAKLRSTSRRRDRTYFNLEINLP